MGKQTLVDMDGKSGCKTDRFSLSVRIVQFVQKCSNCSVVRIVRLVRNVLIVQRGF